MTIMDAGKPRPELPGEIGEASARKALEAARQAYEAAIPDGQWYRDGGETDAPMHAAIQAYLSSARNVGAANALKAVRPIVKSLIDAEYNVETWGLRARLAAIDAALASDVQGWRTIENVPTHRSVILCWRWKHQPTAPLVAEGYLDWDGVTWRMQSGNATPEDYLPPTHWRPLPAPPSPEPRS